MKLPIIEIVVIKDFSAAEVCKQLSLMKFGQTPFAFDLINIPTGNHLEAAQNISDQLHFLGIKSYFPYPIIIISSHLKDFDELPTVKKEAHLPSHFQQKGKRLKNKEASLMHKVELLSEKIENYNADQKLEELKKYMKSNKKLYDLSKELNFYQIILENNKHR